MAFDLSSAPLPQFSSLDKLFEFMMAMTDDPLAKSGSNVVICRGNPNAGVLLIGEAPGPQENIQGKPFVGKAGQLLDQILKSVHFDTQSDVFIVNSVFRMPPGENGVVFRKPTNNEIIYYRKYVREIIRLTNPDIILLAGNVACQSLLDQTGITRMRGEWIQFEGHLVMPIFHPSYLLRNPSRDADSPKALMWKDIQEIRRKYDELKGENTKPVE
ncbi:MAG: uracil-DNA glycosylase [Chloroflexi bacterium]|jgi:uracil-DNA glycosylase|nr:uracil-DNA glycosylase [Chloroflexota bacterium]MBT3668659.1 uracil-DNA glycosylase [Chloroflexota bacterium]MBT4001870.1 uracil-DNA glycosylase [Chloroflexota bacterium]MBT4305360.1 uracil-DNA glycosylase [Chloroflexota bacterium]MBT4532506.1 uracil-DNA glycosylase [Chloroflexota bacterium]